MLRITQSNNALGASKYFEEGLQRADYYGKEDHTLGQWGGLGAQQLGLSGEVDKAEFVALCHNQTADGKKLTPRNKSDRRVGYDFTFSVPKSVSLAYAVKGDERIMRAFETAVEQTMQELEQDMRTQVWRDGNKHYDKTGNMIWASFTHRTSRPVDGIPDPHLHRHCFVMNATYHTEKERFQAGEFSILKKTAPYYEAAFDARLAIAMKELGYGIDHRGYSWELTDIASPTLSKFSRRTQQVEARATAEAQEAPLTARQKDRIGAVSRAKKVIGQSWEKLQAIWQSWMTSGERDALHLADRGQGLNEKRKHLDAREAVKQAALHLLERKSVVKATQLKAAALKRGFGVLTPESVNQAVAEGQFHRRETRYETLLTTDEALREENSMLASLRAGRGTQLPLNPNYQPKAAYLNEEQRAAIRHVLNDRNQVTIVAGGAGVGKTTLMKEVRQGIEAKGTSFYGFAPSAAASRGVMREEGFEKADTVARLLVDEALQAQTRNGVIWIDEAGLLGNKTMNQLFAIARKQQARLLLTGDIRQHSSVAAGDALRILEQEGGITVARVNQIQRQRNTPLFKRVVESAANDRMDQALHQLERLGGVKVIGDQAKRQKALIEEYGNALQRGYTALIIAPTHQEGNAVTDQLRTHLQQTGQLSGKEREVLQLQSTQWTQEQKGDIRQYLDMSAPLHLEFHQHVKGHRKGERWKLQQQPLQTHAVEAQRGSTNADIALLHAQRFTVYREKKLMLAKGDRIRITKGGKTREGSRINNGDLFTIEGFTRQGHLKLHTGKTLDKAFGHLTRGFTTTSHASQGKTVDMVFVAQSADSLPASSKEQFYVSLSRARKMAMVYTDDREALEKAVRRSGERLTARELVYQRDRQQYAKASIISSTTQQNYATGKAL